MECWRDGLCLLLDASVSYVDCDATTTEILSAVSSYKQHDIQQASSAFQVDVASVLPPTVSSAPTVRPVKGRGNKEPKVNKETARRIKSEETRWVVVRSVKEEDKHSFISSGLFYLPLFVCVYVFI